MARASTSTPARQTPGWQIAALWLLVAIPALWGFIETLRGAVRLFTS